jgi:hypothetical protein
MGQQQLLLLVLSTVIVGLATVAGIQAFSENQAQASQDALVQRGTSIASDIQGLYGKPSQLGGIEAFDNNGIDGATVADRLGYDHSSGVVDADGAGSNGRCQIETSGNTVQVDCASDNADQDVRVTFDPSATEPVTTSFSGDYSVSS